MPFNATLPCAGCETIATSAKLPSTPPARLMETAVANAVAASSARATGASVGGGGAEIVIASGCVAVPAALLALTVALKLPAALGVPAIAPLAVFTARPGGSPEAPKLVGPLLAAIW